MDLAYTSLGSGRPVVLLHGLLGSGDNLRSVAKWIQSGHTVFLPDLPNHGSSPHVQEAGYRVMVDSVAEFIRDRSISNPIVGGHSMGGKVAMRLALASPGLVRALLILDISPQRYQPSHTTILDAMESLDPETITSRADAERRLVTAIPEKPVRSFLLKNLVRDGDGYRWRLNLPAIRRSYDDILGWDGEGVFDGPALFVGGGQSHYLHADRDEKLVRSHFPNATIRMIPDAGHWLHADAPDELREIVCEFMEGV